LQALLAVLEVVLEQLEVLLLVVQGHQVKVLQGVIITKIALFHREVVVVQVL
jgi:hypothetical protein